MLPSKRMTFDEAMRRGFTVDCTIYPHVAYMGKRIDPIEWHECMTEYESELLARLGITEKALHEVKVILNQVKEDLKCD
jgi:hypothetical protein